MTCKLCNDTGVVTSIDKRYDTLVTESCNCQPSIKTCSENHVPITFRQFACPLCASLIRNLWVEAEMRKLRGLIRSDVQQMQDRAQIKKQPVIVKDVVPDAS